MAVHACHRRRLADRLAVAAGAVVATLASAFLWCSPLVRAEPVRIMPLGDSITRGGEGGYRTRLFNKLNEAGHTIDFVGSSRLSKDVPHLADHDHEGHGGWRVNNLQRNITEWIGDYQPDVILLHIGTNDISNGDSAVRVARDLSDLLELTYAASPDVTVYVASIIQRTDRPELAEITRRYAALTPHVVEHWAAQGYDARFVDMHAAILASDLEDGVHPTDRGYDKMGYVWASVYEGTPSEMPLFTTIPRAGHRFVMSAQGAEPGEEVQFFGTTAPLGSTPLEKLNVTLDIASPAYLGAAVADHLGIATLEGVIPAERSGQIVRLQAAAMGKTSQVIVKKVRQ